jgi:hypothetical protein
VRRFLRVAFIVLGSPEREPIQTLYVYTLAMQQNATKAEPKHTFRIHRTHGAHGSSFVLAEIVCHK